MVKEKYVCFSIKQILGENVGGIKALLAFGWTSEADEGNNFVANDNLYYGHPLIMKKIYMAAQLWLGSMVLHPYLMSIGTQNPLYKKHSFMLMNPKETGDNEKT